MYATSVFLKLITNNKAMTHILLMMFPILLYQEGYIVIDVLLYHDPL